MLFTLAASGPSGPGQHSLIDCVLVPVPLRELPQNWSRSRSRTGPDAFTRSMPNPPKVLLFQGLAGGLWPC